MVIKVKDLVVLAEKLKSSPAYVAATQKKEEYKGKPLYTKDDDNFLVYELVEEIENILDQHDLKINDLVEMEISIKKVEVDAIEIKVD